MSDEMTSEEFRRIYGTDGDAPKKPKYGNRRIYTDADGRAVDKDDPARVYRFDSGDEYQHWRVLRERERLGEITRLRVHPQYVVIPAFDYFGATYPATVFTPDFAYFDLDGGGIETVVDVKSDATEGLADFRLRALLFMREHPTTAFYIVNQGVMKAL